MVYKIVIINLLILLGTSICAFKWKDHMWKIVCLTMLIIYVGNLFYWTISLSEFHMILPFEIQWSINDLKIEGLANFVAETWFDLVSFIPIGVLLSFFFHYSYPTSKRIRQALFFCLLICVVFSTFRYLCSYGVFDSVKIELNIFGGIIGIVIHYMFLSKINIHPLSNRVEDRKKYDRKELCMLIWKDMKDYRIVWILFAVSLVVPYLPFDIDEQESQFLKNLITMFNNLSYSYIAGAIFYVFSSMMPRIRKTYRARQKLQSTYSSIHTNFVIIANLLNCIENGKLCKKAEDSVIRKLEYKPISGKSDSKDSLFCKVKQAIAEVFDCEKKIKPSEHEFVVSVKKVKVLNAFFTMNANEIDESLLLYADVLTTDELKALNGLRHCFDKLFYSMINQNPVNDYFIIPKADIEYFASDFISKYLIAESLKQEYSRYSYSATHSYDAY